MITPDFILQVDYPGLHQSCSFSPSGLKFNIFIPNVLIINSILNLSNSFYY